MTTRVAFGRIVCLLVCVLSGSALQARQSSDNRHIRALSPHLQQLLDGGTAQSSALQRQVAHLESSDMVVYLECEAPVMQLVKARPPARLVFLANAGGQRYVVVRLDCRMSEHRQLMMMAHEFRHAEEIAAAPEVVDSASLRGLYERVGFLSRHTGETRAFETHAAVKAEGTVGRELSRGDGHLAAPGPFAAVDWRKN